MKDLSIKTISLYGFIFLCLGALLSGVVLVSLLFRYESIHDKEESITDSYDAIFVLRYNTEKLLTTNKLMMQREQWRRSVGVLNESVDRLNIEIPDETGEINKLLRVINKEVVVVSEQLDNPLFSDKNIMEKSLLRRFGEGLSAQEKSDSYINVRTLVNAIDYLQQYETFLLDELRTLTQHYSAYSNDKLKETKQLLVMVPAFALLLLAAFASVIFHLSGRVEGKLLGIQRNLSETLNKLEQEQNKLKKHRDILDHMAHHDALTGSPNRLRFMKQVEDAIHVAGNVSKRLAVLFIDLDRFKEINDSLGHNIGDAVLKEVAERFSSVVEKEDNFARLGGDEFTMLVESFDSRKELKILARKVIGLMQDPICIEDHDLYMSCSIGVSVYPDDSDSAENLLRNADSAMYKAKAEGKNNYQFYTSDMTEIAYERVKLESCMRKALEEDEFELYYQPQVDLKSEKISFEALIRWNTDDLGVISPASFIPVAEETDLIIPIGEWVLKEACQQIVAWREDGLEFGHVAVNVASKQLHDRNFYSKVKQTLKETGCQPEWLELEVTEGVVMRDPEHVSMLLRRLRKIGVVISVDDFGTGYSSLAYLKDLPIDKLKIDQSFLINIPIDNDNSEIVKAVITLARGLQLSVIAEGVETKEQKEFLVAAGCLEMQGYYYSRPLPGKEAKKYILKKSPFTKYEHAVNIIPFFSK